MEPLPFVPDPVNQQRVDALMITSVVMTVMAGIIVILRSISRFILIRSPGPDDYLILGALLLVIGYLVDLFIMKENHMGFPMAMLTLKNMTVLLQGTLAIEVMYYTIIACIKCSIVFTYLRFAISRTFRYLCIGTIVFHVTFFIVSIITTLAQCRPLAKMWTLDPTFVGTCIDTTAFFYSTSGVNIITDIWIILLPIPTLRTIQRPGGEKVALFCIFGVGTFAAVASVVRLHSIREYTQAEDPFRDAISVNLWSMIEVNIAIMCGSVSALKPVFSRAQRMRTRTAASGSGRSRGASGSGGTQDSKYRWPRAHRKLDSRDNQLNSLGSLPDKPFPATAALPPLTNSSAEEPDSPTTRSSYATTGGPRGGGGYDNYGDQITTPKRARFGGAGGFIKYSTRPRTRDRPSEDAPTSSEENMIAFTPLKPPPRQSQTEDQLHGLPIGPLAAGGPGEVSSSGSVLVLQRPQ